MKKIIVFIGILLMLPVNAMASKHLDVNVTKQFISVHAIQTQAESILKAIEKKSNIGFVFIDKTKPKEVSLDVSNIPTNDIGKILYRIGYTNYAIVYEKKKTMVYILPKGISSDAFRDNYSRIKHLKRSSRSKDVVTIKGKPIEHIYQHPNDRYQVKCIKNEIILKASPHLRQDQIDAALKKYHLERKDSELLSKVGYIKAKLQDGHSLNDIIPVLRNNPEFSVSEPNYLLESMSSETQSYQWHITETQFDQAWPLLNNQTEIKIAIIDSGVNAQHPDLKNKVLAGYDFYNADSDASDDHGHGTFVAGIIAASENVMGVKGLYGQARIIPVKVLGDAGQGTYEDTASGIVWAVDHHAQVINLSIGSYAFSHLLRDAVNYALEKGCVVVASAGNEGVAKEMYPAAYPDVIAVSALGQDGHIWPKSNKGRYIDFCAPGEQILSTGLNDSYVLSDGTSASAAVVSSLAAMLISEFRNGSNIFIRERIAQTAQDMGKKGRDFIYGDGKINAYAAVSKDLSPFHDVTVRSVDIQTPVITSGQPVIVVSHIVNVGTYSNETCTIVFKEIQKEQTTILEKQQVQISGVKDIFFEWMPVEKDVQFEIEVICQGDAYPSNNTAVSRIFDINQKDQFIYVQHKSEVEFQVHEFIAGEGWELVRRYLDATEKKARVLAFSGSSTEMTEDNMHQTIVPVSETPTYAPENHQIVFSGSKKMLEEFDDHIGERILHECGKSLKRSLLVKPTDGVLNNLSLPMIPDYVAEAEELGSVNMTYTGKIRDNAAPGYILSEYSRDFPFSIYYHTLQMSGARDDAYESFIEDVYNIDLPSSWWSTGETYSSEDAYEGAEDNETGMWGTMTDTAFQGINLGNDDVIEGSHEEDVFDVARNHAHFMGVLNSDNFDHHFWEADSYHDGAFNDGLFITKASAWTVSEDLWAFAIDQYKKGNKDRAFYYLGRVVHLLEDMGCPPHVHNDPHPSYAPYEYVMGKVIVNGEIKNRDEYPKGRSIYLDWHTDTLKKVLVTDETSVSALEIRNNPSNYLSDDMPLVIKSYETLKNTDPQTNYAFKEYKDLLEAEGVSNIEEDWRNRTDLFRIFYSMNELSDDFPSGDYDGDIIKNHDDDDSDMKDYNSYHYYAPAIQPAIIEHLAGLYLLFWKETHAFVSDSVKNDLDQPVEGALVELFEEGNATPKDTVQTDENGRFSFYDIESVLNHTIQVSKSSHITYTSAPFQVEIGETTESINPVITAIRPLITNLSDTETPVQYAQWSWDADQPATFRYAIDQNSDWEATGDFIDIKTASISDKEGLWYLHVQAKNADEIVSEIVTVSVQLDQTPPEDVSFSVVPDQLSNENVAVFEIQSQDVALYKYQVDLTPLSSEYTGDIPITLTDLADGVHSIIIFTADIAGNWQSENEALAYTWTVDKILPVISGLEDDSEPAKSKLWEWSASEECSYRFAIDQNENWEPEGDFENITTISKEDENGEWFIHVQAKDLAGNLSEIMTVSAILDNTPPALELISHPESLVNQTNAVFGLQSDDASHYKFRLNQGAFSGPFEGSTPLHLTDLGDGEHTIDIIAGDSAGNWQHEDDAQTYSWTVDTISPIINGLENDSEPAKSKMWEWSASEDCSFRFAIDQNENWEPEGDFENITTISKEGENGEWFIHVQAKDLAGNLSEVVSVSVILDNNAPDKATLVNVPDDVVYINSFSIDVIGEDISHYKYQLDSLPYNEERTVTDQIQLNDLDEGSHSLRVVARDLAGNWQSESDAATALWQIILVDKGDLNNDNHINLIDAILTCKILSGMSQDSNIYILADIDNNQQIGLAELIFILQRIVWQNNK